MCNRRGSGCLLLAAAACLFPAGFAQSPPANAASRLAEADRLQQESRFELAVSAYEGALAAAREAKDQPAEAAALQGIGTAESSRGNYLRARQVLDQCLALREKLGDAPGMGEVLNGIGNVAFAQGETQAAKGYYERSLELRSAAGNRAGVAASWNNLGNVARIMGLYLESAEYLERSQRAFEELGDQRRRCTVLKNLGSFYGDLGDFDHALSTLRVSLELAEQLQDNLRIANALDGIGVVHTWMGNYRAALDELSRARKMREDLKFDWGVAETLNNIGLAFQAQSDHPQALAFFEKALRLNQKLGDKGLEAESRLNVGVELLAEGRLTESLQAFDQSIRISSAQELKPLLGEALRGLGRVRLRLGRPAEALADLERALKLQQEMSDRAGIADTTVEMAAARLQLGDSTAALTLARRAATLALDIPRPDTLWQARLISAKALRAAGDARSAAADLDEAIATIETLRNEVAGPATALPAYFGDRLAPYRERFLVDLSGGDVTGALVHAERSKARALAETIRAGRPAMAQWMTPEERRQERALENQLAALNLETTRVSGVAPHRNPAELRTQLESKRRELESLRTTLFARHPELALRRTDPQPIQAKDMQALAAAAHAAILDFVVTPNATYLFVVTQAGPPRLYPIQVSAAVLRNKAAEFRRQLASQDLGFAALSRELYRLLVAPAAAELSRYPAWIVVPDESLWDVAFSALQSRPGHFLIDDAAIAYTPSMAVLRATLGARPKRDAAAGPYDLLVVGNPADRASERLPLAEQQAVAIESLYGRSHSKILTGAAATEERIKAEAGRYDVVHLAAHAVLDDASPMYSRVLLATPGAGSREDGFLEAWEMMELNLYAEMVVLSGCETASGHASPGEGITGMLWAMFVAGAPTTVASMWPVESASTALLMVEFHRQFLATRQQSLPFRKAAALRAAARLLLADPKYAHPFYWAAFIVAGNPD